MGTEVAISFSTLRAQLENEKNSLYKIDENIKKIVQTSGRYSDRSNNSSAEYGRSGLRIGGRNSVTDTNSYKNDDGKRKHETKTAFSRLSAKLQDSDGEDEGHGGKRVRVPSAVCKELPTRDAILRAQGDDAQTRTRNRRMFGSLLGTLQKFKQEEIVLQSQEEKKAQVERKIEEQARQEKEREQKERKTLFAEREHKKAKIKALEAKMGRVQEFERWEASQKTLGNFILTKTKPHIYWLPKKMCEKASEKLNSSRKFHEKYMAKKHQELQEGLVRLEQRCLRIKGSGTNENDLSFVHNNKVSENNPHAERDLENSENDMASKSGTSKRNKFAMEGDQKEKDDSDGDERHEQSTNDEQSTKPKDEKVPDDSHINTIVNQDVNIAEITINKEDSIEQGNKEGASTIELEESINERDAKKDDNEIENDAIQEEVHTRMESEESTNIKTSTDVKPTNESDVIDVNIENENAVVKHS